MSVLKPRNRLVYFRISEDEFRKVEDMWQAEGARSLSDFARAAVQRVIADGACSPDAMLREKLRTIDQIIGQLNQKLEQLDTLLTSAGNDGNVNGELVHSAKQTGETLGGME